MRGRITNPIYIYIYYIFAQRLRVRKLTIRWLTNKENGKIQMAFNTWQLFCRSESAKETDALNASEFQTKLHLENDKKLKLSLKIVQALLNASMASALQGWKTFVSDTKRGRLIVNR